MKANEQASDASKVWPLGGYAPGNYTCKCLGCDEQFVGDKRSTQCLDCAIIWANKAISEHQRRASVVTPEMVDLVRRLNVAADGVETVSFDRLSLRRGYERLLREAAAALSVVSHETGDGETKTLPERCPECSLHWGHNPPAIISGSDQVRCIECKSVFPAPTDETQGVKREAVAWQRRVKYSDVAGAVPQWQSCSTTEATGLFEKSPHHEYRPLFSLSQLEAADARAETQWAGWVKEIALRKAAEASLAAMTGERDTLRGQVQHWKDMTDNAHERRHQAQASLAVMREALRPFADATHMLLEDYEDAYTPDWSPFITAGAYRAARAALAAGENGQ